MATKKKKKKTAAKKTKALSAVLEEQIALVEVARVAKGPNEPVPQFAAFAARMALLAGPEKKKLLALPNFKAWWLEVAVLGAALSEAELLWSATYAKSRAGLTPAKKKEAEAHKAEIMRCARYLLRDDPFVQQELDQITIGTGIADLAMDLEHLAGLVDRHRSSFVLLADDAAPRARTLAAELRTGVEPGDAADLQDRRNRLFWTTLEAVSQLRAALRFLWAHEPHKLAELGNTYAAQLRKEARQKKKKKKQPA